MYIASASSVVQFHATSTNELLLTYETVNRNEGPCRSLSWSKDGKWLVVVPQSGCAEIVTVKRQCKLLHTVRDVSEPSCASFQNLSKRTIAVGTKHGQVLLYDIKSRTVQTRFPRTLTSSSREIAHIGFTAKDTHCYAGCSDGSDVSLFSNATKSLSCILRVPKSSSVTALKAHSHKRNYLVAGSNEGVVAVWDVNVNKVKFQTDAHDGPVTATIFSPVNSSLVVSAGRDRLVRVFDADTKTSIKSIPLDNNVMSLDFAEDALYIAMGAQNGKLHIYDTRNLQAPVTSVEAHKSAVNHVAYQSVLFERRDEDSTANITGESAANNIGPNDKRNFSDFFDQVVVTLPTVLDGQEQNVPAESGGDSFLKALGFDQNNSVPFGGSSMVSLKEEEPEAKPVPKPNRLSLNWCTTPNPIRTTQNMLYEPKTALKARQLSDGLSPILGDATARQNDIASKERVQGAIQEANKELRKTLEDMEKKLSFLIMDHAHRIRQLLYDLHMANLKNFITMEDSFRLVREEVCSQRASAIESHLIMENSSLRKKIHLLKEQIETWK